MINPPVTYQGVVYPWHCDHMGHMNVMWYGAGHHAPEDCPEEIAAAVSAWADQHDLR